MLDPLASSASRAAFLCLTLHKELILVEIILRDDSPSFSWLKLVETVCYCPDNRVQAAIEWLKEQRRSSGLRISARSGWTKNQERDALIRDELAKGTERIDICRKLDERGIATPPTLQRRDCVWWLDAWSDVDARQSVQTIFSKIILRYGVSRPPSFQILSE